MKLKRAKYDRKNEYLQQQVDLLFKLAKENKVNFWKRVAEDLLKPTRKQPVVNLDKLEKFGEDNRVVVVAGKVLGYGELSRKVKVAAFNFSDSAKSSIEKAGGTVLSIEDFAKKNPKATDVKLLE